MKTNSQSWNLNLQVKILASGQPRPYMDFKNVVQIKNLTSYPVQKSVIENIIHELMAELYPPRRGTPIDSTEKLVEVSENTWQWTQDMPFTD